MGASFAWSESNLVGEVVTDGIVNLNFGSADDHDLVVLSNKILRTTNSFSKYIRIKFTGVWVDITNMLFWKSAGVLLAGESVVAGANVLYATPTQTDTGDSAIPTTEGTALAIDSYEGANHIEYGVSGVSGYTDYIRLQLQTTGSTPTGAVNQKTFTFQWDES
jgi:hypothetical protein